jgi:hypothetical protein
MIKLPFGSQLKAETRHFLDQRIQHDQFLTVLEAIGNTHATGMSKARGMLLLGDTGTGKTTIADTYIDKYLQECGSLESNELTRKPILKISIPSDATTIGILTKLLGELDHEDCVTGTQARLMHRFIKAAKAYRVEMLILDEFQHLLRNQAQKRTRQAANTIKTLHDDLNIPILMIGMPESRQIIEAHSELYRRFTYEQIELKSFSLDSEEETESFRNYIKSCASILLSTDVKTTKLWSDSMLLRFHVATSGKTALISRIFEKVLQKTELSETLKKEHFANVYTGMRLVPEIGPFNPFLASIEACEKRYAELHTQGGEKC